VPNQEGFAADLKEAREVILRLSPGRLCRGALLNLGDLMVDVAGGVAGDVFRAILALISLGAGLSGFVPVILGALAGSAVSGAFKQLLKRLTSKVGEPGSEVIKCFMEFMNTAREASRYIEYEEVQDLVNNVAREWGMGSNEFKNLVRGFASLMEDRFVTKDEVRRLFKNGLRKVEELEAKVNELNNWVNLLKQKPTANIIIAGKADFEQGIIYPNIKVENGELRIRVEDGYHSIVRVGKFNELVNKVRGRLTSNGFVVVVGPKGIGKSTLAAAAVWELLMNNDIGLVARVDVLNEDNYSGFKTFVENYSERFGEYFGRLLILYDPVSTETYEREPSTQQGRGALAKTGGGVRRVRYAKMLRDAEATIANLINASSELGDLRPPILIVLPSDIYNALSEEVKNALEVYRLDVSQALSDREFLAGLIREYTRTSNKPNGCELSNDVLSKLAGELVKFDSGHALIARLIGEELVRNNCDVGKVEELISKAKGKAEALIILHINGLFKVHENSNAETLVKVFALRRPFVNEVGPGDPILTPGIVELIGEERRASLLQGDEGEELRGWLARRQHDLIEDSIGELLRCIVNVSKECKEKLGTSLKPWRLRTVRKSLREISEKVRDEDSAVDYFVSSYGEKLTEALKDSSNCWRRATLIIGHALAGHSTVPRPEDLPAFLPESLRKDVVESLGNALKRCGVDDYLLVDDVIPPLIRRLIRNYARALTEAFIDKYNEAVGEVNRILKIVRKRGIYGAEEFYGLGLASIIAKAVESGKPVRPSDADVVLHFTSSAIQHVASTDLIMPILLALEPLCGKAPHRYLELLAPASNMENLDLVTVRYIFKELNEILDKYGDVVKGHAWSLVHAIDAYAVLLGRYPAYFDRREVGDVVRRIIGLLNELGRYKSSLGIIAWAFALASALRRGIVRGLMEKALSIDVVNKASEILGELSRLRGLVQDLMRDEEFMSYIESRSVKADEKTVKEEILNTASFLKHALAQYKLDNDEPNKAEELFNEAAKELREINDYENYLAARVLALRAKAIKGSLIGNELTKLRNELQQLYKEAFDEEHFMPTARYLSTASHVLGDYLVSLALTGDDKTISELLRMHWRVLNANRRASVLSRLMLNVLLSPRGRLSGELEGRLVVESRGLINAFESEFLPALMVAFGIAKPEDGIKSCEKFNDEGCIDSVLAVKGNSAAFEQLRKRLIDNFQELLNAKFSLLKRFGVDTNKLLNEFKGLVNEFDGKSLAQLIAPVNSRAQLALMLHALVNGNEKLTKAHALYGAANVDKKLLTRLFLEAYEACCDLGSEGFRHAIAKLFFYHV
jgi:energy-coupling factor transporter ATP-binding protein EcfA2